MPKGSTLRISFPADARKTEEYILAHQGKKNCKYSPFSMKNPDCALAVFEHFNLGNLYFTPNTYFPDENGKVTAKTASMNRCRVFGIDIDYKKNPKYVNYTPVHFYGMISEEIKGFMPLPNWIEYSNQLRLVYILSESIMCKCGLALYRGLVRVQQQFYYELNLRFDCYAEPQKAWYRVPGSVNSKNGGYVSVEKIPDVKYSTQELLTDFMPELPMSKADWEGCKKQKKKNKKKKKAKKDLCLHPGWSLRRLYLSRMEDFKKMALNGYCANRKKLCFLYGVNFCLAYPDKMDDAVSAVLDFNKTLTRPLPEKEIRSKLRTLPHPL